MADKILEDLFDRFDAMDSRATWGKFQEKYSDAAKKWNDARKTFAEMAEKDRNASEFIEPFKKAREELVKVADRDIRGIFVPKSGAGKEEFKKAKDAFDNSRTALVQYFKGLKDAKPSDAAVTEAFKTADDVGRTVIKTIEGWGMKVKLEGWKAAANDNVLGVLDEAVTKNRKGAVYARVAFTGVGAAMMGHALIASKTADGDDRSVLMRVAEGAVGAGLAGASVFAGGAR